MTFNVLFVCTGNRCRSPIAEGLLRVEAEKQGLDVDISSAGLLLGGIPAEKEAVISAAAYGADIAAHRSRELTPEMLDAADVVFVMERMHLREISVMRGGFAKTFLFKTFAEEGERTAASLIGATDVADPIGQSQEAFDRCAAELHGLVLAAIPKLQSLGLE